MMYSIRIVEIHCDAKGCGEVWHQLPQGGAVVVSTVEDADGRIRHLCESCADRAQETGRIELEGNEGVFNVVNRSNEP